MGISYNPSIVTEGLVLGLDPQSPRFYNYKGRSVAFDGSGDYLSVPATADFDLGSGKTYELWFKLDTISTNKLVAGSSNNHWFGIGYTSIGGAASKVGFSVLDGSWNAVNSTTNIAVGSWYHVAATWDGTNVKLYLNGVLEATSADWSAKTWASNNGNAYNIGGFFGDSTTSIDGVISNFRITDSVVYTSNFTPPTEPLTAVTNTKLLTCQGNTISDASSSAHSITPNGNVVIDYNGPFSGSGWTDLTNRGNNGTLTNGPVFIPGGPFNNSGGSVYFDGSGDYIDADASSPDFELGSDDFTIETWVLFNSNSPNDGGIISKHTIAIPHWVELRLGSTQGAILTQVSFDGTSWGMSYQSNNLVTTNVWYHIALVRSGSVFTTYINGVANGTASSASSISNNTSYPLRLGARGNADQPLDGYISNLRIVKGTALYTSNFTPPTGPLEAVDDTVLLTCQGGAITDNGPSSHAITVNNDAEAITASAFEFDGTDDYVAIASNSNFNLGTGDFAVEIWVYLNDITSNSGFVGIINRHNYSTNTGWGIWKESGGKFGFWYNAVTKINGTTNVSTNSWYHIVATRLGSTITLYVNGVSENSATNSSFTDSSTSLGIGVANVGGAWNDTYPVNGYISNTRVYKGKGLTEDEVKRNFSALRGRYGI